ncbi:MAG: prepilin-type N-terminal cleavage/methylation domain-containing protein [Bacilli bacterium]|nr:prepilin-type N-terminal cleavage/methylation domain-containing protein [Bacilli bacterium]
MKNKAYTLIELLSVIVILAIVSAIAVPRIIDVIGMSKINAYNVSKKNIVKSAKLKYLADVNDSLITEYTVDDLITDGYLKKDIKNPITNDNYKNTKVLITNDGNNINYEYVEGKTLYDIIIDLNDNDGLFKDDNNYIYKGISANNYISFNGEIYRIVKVDSYRNIYLINNEIQNKISKEKIDEYLISYYNDNYSEIIKNNILSVDILNYNDLINSFLDNETFINSNNDIWVKDNNKYKVISNLNNKIIDKNKANAIMVLKIKSSCVIKSGNGSQLNPYEI